MNYTNTTFMDKYAVHVYASLLILCLAAFVYYRTVERKSSFDKAVTAAHKVSVGYDESFRKTVDRLEATLAERASFGYAGERDPMTGAVRTVITRSATPAPRVRSTVGTGVAASAQERDQLRLTATIFDDTRRTFTAVMMNGGRSLSVDVGDVVLGRRVTRITNYEVHMESATERFVYDIMGDNRRSPK